MYEFNEKLKILVLGAIGFVAFIFVANSVVAEVYTVNGKVIAVEDVYQTRIDENPKRVCNEVDVPVYGKQGNSLNDLIDIPGAIIGGVIGNNVTKDIPGGGTAGAIIGGLIGGQRNQQNNITGYRTVQQCKTIYDRVEKRFLAGQRITYTVFGLKGKTFKSGKYSVGDNIRVQVQFTAN
jgi:uncharacterized protein YcfJ|tara:strand:+ start:315 stop:851 length:537 start_codon:yes stop_codon:yes gene_type:complete